MYKIRGKVLDSNIETIENKKGGEPYKKMLITIEEANTNFSNKHQFELFGKESIEAQQGKVKIGGFIKIDFYIKSNEWKGKYFVSLNVKDILVEDQATKLTEDLPF